MSKIERSMDSTKLTEDELKKDVSKIQETVDSLKPTEATRKVITEEFSEVVRKEFNRKTKDLLTSTYHKEYKLIIVGNFIFLFVLILSL